ncbi:MAG: c-type cytochrome [Acidobacteria bacterium]|nr:c-type cytochrome [Acidobacteriota bacterium]
MAGRSVERRLLPAVLTGAIAASAGTAAGQQARGGAAVQSAVERGRYLITVQDCNGCHTPFTPKGEPDMSRMLSGHPQNIRVTAAPRLPLAGGWIVAINETNTAWAGPWGVSFTSNLTPDRVTGIGTWTEQIFIASIRNGKKSGVGRDLLPPMPWRMYAKLTDEDLRAIYAYLMSTPAISNRVPEPLPPAGGK